MLSRNANFAVIKVLAYKAQPHVKLLIQPVVLLALPAAMELALAVSVYVRMVLEDLLAAGQLTVLDNQSNHQLNPKRLIFAESVEEMALRALVVMVFHLESNMTAVVSVEVMDLAASILVQQHLAQVALEVVDVLGVRLIALVI